MDKSKQKTRTPSVKNKVFLEKLARLDFQSAYGHDPELCKAVKIVMKALRGERPGISV